MDGCYPVHRRRRYWTFTVYVHLARISREYPQFSEHRHYVIKFHEADRRVIV